MKRYIFLALAALLAPVFVGGANGSVPPSPPVPAWLQYTATGLEFRAVLPSGVACSTVVIDGHDATMTVRAAGGADFPAICSIVVPQGTKSLKWGAADVKLPVADPQRILVLGDTGCRIKGAAVQACNDPKAWPFAGLAAAAAALKPDLIVHLGDYLYRESACPEGNAGCAGSPWGDNWKAWDADFFTPGAPLLAAAPWIVIRGNHEDCQRAGPGFLRLLGPVAYDPAAACAAHLDPYAVTAGGQTIAVVDTASAPDQGLDDKVVATFQKDFAGLKGMTDGHHPLWLASHRPIWAAITGPAGVPIGGNVNLIEAAGNLRALAAVSLMLAGHIHSFESINYVTLNGVKLPPQIVAGHGGDNLDVTPTNLKHAIFQGHSGVNVRDGLSVGGFGFLMMTRAAGSEGWSIQLYDSAGVPGVQCQFESGRVFCLKPM